MQKITTSNPIVNMTGDEMAAVMWSLVKKNLINPFVEFSTIDYDLSIHNRDNTDDLVTQEAAHALLKHKIGVKCATITPNKKQTSAMGLKKQWRSPNATIRKIMNGTIIREPIVCNSFKKVISHWKKPIIIIRHGYGDQYDAFDFSPETSTASIFVKDNQTGEQIFHKEVLKGDVLAILSNTNTSIHKFAEICFKYALLKKMDLYLSTKNTILRNYDGAFSSTFEDIYNKHYKKPFTKLSIKYQHKLIDDMVAMSIRSSGGFIWACKNYDGDVQSDCIAQGYGSLGLMKSLIVGGERGDVILLEAAHGTVSSHYSQYKENKPVSTNPIATIFTWAGALFHLADKESNEPLKKFSALLEEKTIQCIDREGIMTKDMALNIGPNASWTTTHAFIQHIHNSIDEELKNMKRS